MNHGLNSDRSLCQATIRNEEPSLKGKRILILADDIIREGGVRTRVMEELACLRAVEGISVFLASRCYARNLGEIQSPMFSVRKDTGLDSIRVIAYPKIPHGGIPLVYEFSIVANAILGLLILVPWALFNGINIVYGHNNECGMIAVLLSRVLGIPCIVDSHGVEVDEYLERHPAWNPSGMRARFLRILERFVLTGANALVCVSNAHRETILIKTGRAARVYVVPCFADERLFFCERHSRQITRRKLGVLPEEILFVYAGVTPEPYDEFSPILAFSNLENVQNKKLLMLTPTGESMDIARKQVPPSLKDRILVTSVPRSLVPNYLCAADIALLLRREGIVNLVASPTKFAEYILCGLPVIITENLGDASSMVRDNEIGLVVSKHRLRNQPMITDTELKSLLSYEVKLRARRIGESRISQRAFQSFYISILKSVLRPTDL